MLPAPYRTSNAKTKSDTTVHHYMPASFLKLQNSLSYYYWVDASEKWPSHPMKTSGMQTTQYQCKEEVTKCIICSCHPATTITTSRPQSHWQHYRFIIITKHVCHHYLAKKNCQSILHSLQATIVSLHESMATRKPSSNASPTQTSHPLQSRASTFTTPWLSRLHCTVQARQTQPVVPRMPSC